MKTNTLNVIIALATLSIVTLIATVRSANGKHDLLPILVGYGAVALIASLAMSDNGRGVKPYSTH